MYRCQSCGEPHEHDIVACRLCGQSQAAPPTRKVILGSDEGSSGAAAPGRSDHDTSSPACASGGGESRSQPSGGPVQGTNGSSPSASGGRSGTPVSGGGLGRERSGGSSASAAAMGGAASAKPSGQGPHRWEGRTVLPPDVAYVAPRRSMVTFLWLLVIGISFFAYCSQVIASIVAGFAIFALVFIVMLVLATRWLIFRPFASIMGGAGRMAAGGVMGAAMAGRRGGGAVPVLMARIDAGLSNDVSIKVARAAEGIRQGDHLQVWGPRILGTVRSVFVRNITAGRLFWNLRAITLPLLLIAVVSTPAVVSNVC